MSVAYNIRLFKEIFFPRRCAVCEAKIDDGLLCRTCRLHYTLNKVKVYGANAESWQELEHLGQPLAKQDYFDRTEFLYRYDGVFKDALHRLKFENAQELLPLLKEEAELALQPIAKKLLRHYDYVTCIPTSKERFISRGFDVPWEIFACLKDIGTAKYVNNLVTRSKSTAPLYSMSAQERKIELDGCFSVVDRNIVQNKRILLCDDIFTSGNTMMEAARVLLLAGASTVGVLTLCASKDNWD